MEALSKLKNFIFREISKDHFAIFFKDRRKHLQFIRDLSKKYFEINDFTIIDNYKIPNIFISKIKKTDMSTLLSFGVEFHIDFEYKISKKFNKTFNFFEIDKRSIKWFNENFKNNKNLLIYNFGVSNKNEMVDCYGSLNKNFSSSMNQAFIKNHSNKFSFINQAQVYRMNKILEIIGKKNIDFLKLDIEGEAIKVLNDIIELNIYPKIILCELERPKNMKFESYKKQVMNLLKSIEKYYDIIVSNRNDSFNAYAIEFWMFKK
jgi:FkbM family methyltransferase